MFNKTLNIIKDGEDLILDLGEDFCRECGWNVGDSISFEDNKDGTFTMKKIEEDYVLVTTVSTFKMTYLVKVPKGKTEYAEDSVVMQELDEFVQAHLGEQIVESRIVSPEEIVAIAKKNYHFTESWSTDKILSAYVKVLKDE